MNMSEEQHMTPSQLPIQNEKEDEQLQPEEPEKPQITEQANLEIVEKEEDNLDPSLDDGIIQERILKLMNTENLADVTMPGYVIKLIRMKGSLSFDQIMQETSHCFEALRRADGTRYTGDLFKALKGCLSSAAFREEDGTGLWTVNEREAIDYEERTTQKIKSIVAKQEGKLFGKSEEDESQDLNKKIQDGKPKKSNGNSVSMPENNSETKQLSRQNPRKRKIKHPEEYQKVFDVLQTTCKSYKMDEKTRYLIRSPFDNINIDDPQTRLTQKLGKDKLIGMLQCFDYFFPIIEDYLKLKMNGVNNTAGHQSQQNIRIDTKSIDNSQKVEEINNLDPYDKPEDH